MIKIYKYNPSSTWFRDIVNDSTLKGKERDIAIENVIKEHGTQISIVEYFKDWKRNSYSKDYCYACYGDVENSIERLVNAEINYDEDLIYLNVKNNHSEDLIESRTSWDEMKSYADGLYWFIDFIIGDVIIGKITTPQNTWKPSDEQMYNLRWVGNVLLSHHDSIVEKDSAEKLNSLYEDLKKLKE